MSVKQLKVSPRMYLIYSLLTLMVMAFCLPAALIGDKSLIVVAPLLVGIASLLYLSSHKIILSETSIICIEGFRKRWEVSRSSIKSATEILGALKTWKYGNIPPHRLEIVTDDSTANYVIKCGLFKPAEIADLLRALNEHKSN
jgi:hypothetical protein